MVTALMRPDLWSDPTIALRVEGKMDAGDVFVGAMTFLLALGTFTLAVAAWRDARASRQNIGLTREGIERQDRPHIVPTALVNPKMPVSFTRMRTGGMDLAVGLWNVGRGPAIAERASFQNASGQELIEQEGFDELVVHVGGQGDKVVDLPPGQSLPSVGEQCVLRIFYRDMSDVHYETRSDVEMLANNVCRIKNFPQRRLPDSGASTV